MIKVFSNKTLEFDLDGEPIAVKLGFNEVPDTTVKLPYFQACLDSGWIKTFESSSKSDLVAEDTMTSEQVQRIIDEAKNEEVPVIDAPKPKPAPKRKR